MKISKLFVLGALMLVGSSAMAEIVDGVRQQPKPQTVGFQAEEEYYLYNVDAAQFFTQGNAWGTQASTSVSSGLKVKFAKYTLDGADWDGKTYLFNDYRNNAWFYVFFDNEAAMYVDLGNQTDKNTGWEVETNGGGTFRLSASSTVPTNIPGKTQTFTGGLTKVDGQYVGLDLSSNAANTALHPFLEPGEGICLNWAFVTIEEYEALIPQLEVYAASIPLKEQLDKAKEIGADVTEQEAVYLNENSTVEEINAAIEAAKAIIEAKEKELARGEMAKATADSPVSATPFIVNPDFAGNDGKTGWSGTAFGAVGAKDNAEHYEKTYNTYQTVKGLPAGVYALGVNAFYRAGNAGPAFENFRANNEASKNAKLYAFNGVDTLQTSIVSPYKGAPTEKTDVGSESSASANGVTYYIPNNMEAAEYYMHTLGLYGNTVFNTVEADSDSLTIGVRKDVTIGADWTIFDDFSLTYYGAGADAYQKWYDVTVDNLDVYAGQEITANHTAKYVEEYEAAFAELRGVKVADKAEVLAALSVAEETGVAAANALALNISLWAQFEALIPVAKEVAANEALDENYRWEIGDWVDFDGPDALAALELTNEELQETIDNVSKMIDEARKHPAGTETDMTGMLVNPNFTGNADGWTREAVSGGNVAYGSNCYEAWNNASFDIYQKVADAPKGIYRISVQGFYRYGRGRYQDYLNQDVDEVKPGKAPVYIYLNDNLTSFTNVYGDPVEITDDAFYNGTQFESFAGEDGVTRYYPSDMASGARAFDAGMYTQSAYGVVANDGDVLRIGVKGNSSQTGDSWAIWDNFKLTWLGYDNVELVQPILEETLPISEALLKSTMGKSVKAALEEAINDAKAALGGTEGEPMFNALSALLTANTNANASVAVFKELQTAVYDLSAAIVAAVSGVDVMEEAGELRDEIAGKIDAGEYEDSDVEGLLTEINTMIKRLNVPEEMNNASDANPVDCTSMIVNPDYNNGNNDGWTLDKNPGFNMGLIEVYNNNFDEYQVLEGLPEGTYTVTVQGFYRYGSTENEYDTYTENPEANNYLTLYALVGEDEFVAAMPRLAKDGAEEHTSTLVKDGNFVAGDDLSEGDAWQWAWMTEPEANADSTAATGIRIANGMIPVAGLFEAGKFAGTEVTFKVGEDGKARIGLKKQEETNTPESWCIWDNWKLTYYGPNSSKDLTTGIVIAETVNNATVVKTELFNVNGVRVNSAAKGIILVKETLSNGAVKVKKVTVK